MDIEIVVPAIIVLGFLLIYLLGGTITLTFITVPSDIVLSFIIFAVFVCLIWSILAKTFLYLKKNYPQKLREYGLQGIMLKEKIYTNKARFQYRTLAGLILFSNSLNFDSTLNKRIWALRLCFVIGGLILIYINFRKLQVF